MSNTPLAKKKLLWLIEQAQQQEPEVAVAMFVDGITDHVLPLMNRQNNHKRRVSRSTVKMNAFLGDEARRLRRTTKLTNKEIGLRLNIDGGRVSEANNGKWHH